MVDSVVRMTLDEFAKFSCDLGPDYIYRGQANSNWEIASTFDRRVFQENPKIFGQDVSSHDFSAYFRALMKLIPELNERFNINLDDLKSNSFNKIETYSFLQHFGFPTPNIDWTTSWIIALWFMIENKNEWNRVGCIYILNQSLQKRAFDSYYGSVFKHSFLQLHMDYHIIGENSECLRFKNQKSVMTFSNRVNLREALKKLDQEAKKDGLLPDGEFLFKTIEITDPKNIIREFLSENQINEKFIYPEESFDGIGIQKVLNSVWV